MGDRKCSIAGCDRDFYARGYCQRHYLRERKRGRLPRLNRADRRCEVSGCDLQHYGRGFCARHYSRWKKTGTPMLRRGPTRADRFWAKVDKNGPVPTHRPELGACWLWLGAKNGYSYGSFQGRAAHRVAYELLIGEIPEGLQLDHLCLTKPCVNPSHLEPVTTRENILRGNNAAAVNARKTRCRYGHPFDEKNTRVDKGVRKCRACHADRARRYRRRDGGASDCRDGDGDLRSRVVQPVVAGSPALDPARAG